MTSCPEALLSNLGSIRPRGLQKQPLVLRLDHDFGLECCSADPEHGHVFVFLPLPKYGPGLRFEQSMPYHIHAPFHLSQDRRSLLLTTVINQEEQHKVDTNHQCAKQLALMLLKLLLFLSRKAKTTTVKHLCRLFPPLITTDISSLGTIFWMHLKSKCAFLQPSMETLLLLTKLHS